METRYLSDLTPDPNNVRTHDKRNIDTIAASLKRFGQRKPIVITPQGVVVAGNGTLEAAKQLGWDSIEVALTPEGWTSDEITAYAIADNRTAELAGWDKPLLDATLEELALSGIDLADLGFDLDDVMSTEVVEDEVPEVPTEPITKPGDLWLLGEHRVLCGDSTNAAAVGRLMNGQKATLVCADPPYGMGKEKDGVLNDNLYASKLDSFQMKWWQTFRPHLEDNGSAYVWGNPLDLWRLWFIGGLATSERLTFRNEITWDKGGGGMGVGTEGQRLYFPTERCLFFMIGEQGFNINADNYWDGWDPVVDYLRAERKKTGWDIGKFKRLAGHSEKSGCHWFDKSQWSFPTEDVYKSWQKEAKGDAFKREHDDLKREHDDLKRAFYETRAYFDNQHDNMTDVWHFPRVHGEERAGHPTPKPVAMMERCIRSSSRTGNVVVEPFLGSGTTLIACEQLDRTCYGMELDPAYCDVIVERWETLTGKKAILENKGE